VQIRRSPPAVRAAGERVRFVDERLPALDLAAAKVDQCAPDQHARQQRTLPERAGERYGPLGDGNRRVPVARGRCVLDLDLGGPDPQQRRAELVGQTDRLPEVPRDFVRVAR